MTERILVGIGHPMRGDDSLGPTVIEQLKDTLPSDISTRVIQGDIAELMDIFENYQAVYLVDAIVTGEKPPGTLYQLEGDSIDAVAACRTSTHAFDLGQSIEIARNLAILPKALVVFGIESDYFEQDDQCSSKVKAQIPPLIEMIVNTLNADTP